MKKRILMLTLVLMIVLSSFSISFADPGSFNISPIPSNATAGSIEKYNNAIQLFASECDYVLAFDNGGLCYIVGTNIEDTTQKAHIRNNGEYNYLSNSTEGNYYHSQYVLVNWASDSTSISVNYTGKVQTLVKNYYYSNFAIYGLDYININNPGTQINDYVNPIKTVSINQHQTIVFNYQPQHSTLFMKDLKVTPNKSVVLQQGYYLDGDISFLAIRKDTTGFLNSGALGGYTITMNSFPSPRTLDENEYLAYFQSNDLVSIGEKYAYFTIDTTKCSYKIIAKNTGLVVDSGGLNEEISPPGDITDSSDGYNGITDDFTVDKGDYADGILGAVQYGFDQLIKFAKLPFELLYKFIFALGDIIQYALGSVGALTGSLKSLYGILPASIAYLMTFAITITIFKLIFGR